MSKIFFVMWLDEYGRLLFLESSDAHEIKLFSSKEKADRASAEIPNTGGGQAFEYTGPRPKPAKRRWHGAYATVIRTTKTKKRRVVSAGYVLLVLTEPGVGGWVEVLYVGKRDQMRTSDLSLILPPRVKAPSPAQMRARRKLARSGRRASDKEVRKAGKAFVKKLQEEVREEREGVIRV